LHGIAGRVAVRLLPEAAIRLTYLLRRRCKNDRVGLDVALLDPERLGKIDDLARDRRILVERGGRRRRLGRNPDPNDDEIRRSFDHGAADDPHFPSLCAPAGSGSVATDATAATKSIIRIMSGNLR
jgi:hypothetical protein